MDGRDTEDSCIMDLEAIERIASVVPAIVGGGEHTRELWGKLGWGEEREKCSRSKI
jgi:hypothetical protein